MDFATTDQQDSIRDAIGKICSQFDDTYWLTKDREGAGLGIAIARTIVELSGGHLAIDSRPGLGTTVAVSLPLRQMEQRSAA